MSEAFLVTRQASGKGDGASLCERLQALCRQAHLAVDAVGQVHWLGDEAGLEAGNGNQAALIRWPEGTPGLLLLNMLAAQLRTGEAEVAVLADASEAVLLAAPAAVGRCNLSPSARLAGGRAGRLREGDRAGLQGLCAAWLEEMEIDLGANGEVVMTLMADDENALLALHQLLKLLEVQEKQWGWLAGVAPFNTAVGTLVERI